MISFLSRFLHITFAFLLIFFLSQEVSSNQNQSAFFTYKSFLYNGDFKEALLFCKKQTGIANKGKNQKDLCLWYINTAEALYFNNIDDSIFYYHSKATKLQNKFNINNPDIKVGLNKIYAYYLRSIKKDYESCLIFYQNALSIEKSKSHPDLYELNFLQYNIGMVYFVIEEYSKSNELLVKSLDFFIKQHPNFSNISSRLSLFIYKNYILLSNDVPKAYEYLKLCHKLSVSEIYNTIVKFERLYFYYKVGEINLARLVADDLYFNLIDTIEISQQDKAIFFAYYLSILSLQKEYDIVDKITRQVLTKNKGNEEFLAFFNYHTGLLYYSSNSPDYQKSIISFQKALPYLNKLAYKNYLIRAKQTMALSLRFLKEYEKSLQISQEAYDLQANSCDSSSYRSLNILYDIGFTHFRGGQYEKAIEINQYLLKSIGCKFESSNYFLPPVHLCDYKNSWFPLYLMRNKAFFLYYLSQEEKNPTKKKFYLENSLKHFEIIQNHYNIFLSESDILEKKQMYNSSRKDSTYIILNICHELYNLTNKDAYKLQFLQHLENGKSFMLKESLQGKNLVSYLTPDDPLYSIENNNQVLLSNVTAQYQKMLSKKSPNIDQLLILYDSINLLKYEHSILLEKVKKKYVDLTISSSFDYPINLEKIQKSLENNRAILQYYLYDSVFYSICITSDSVLINKKNIDTTFYLTLNNYRALISKPDFLFKKESGITEFVKHATFLYNLLITPFEAEIKGKRLVIIPDAELYEIPFDCLINPQVVITHTTNFRDLAYLIKSNPISYSYTLGIFKPHLNGKLLKSDKLLAIAPSYNHTFTDSINTLKFKPLPDNLYEVKNITNIVGGTVLAGSKATENLFKKKLGNHGIIHCALHTEINNQNPQMSKLVFEPIPGKEDNFLHVFEINNMKINSSLIVLSACNSGYGVLNRPEGLVGIAYGFAKAGCSSTIFTLWAVADKASSDLMSYFYESLSKEIPKDVALQNAKLQFLKLADPIKSHPFYWAGFVQVGDTNALLFANSKLILYLSILFILTSAAIYIKKKLIR